MLLLTLDTNALRDLAWLLVKTHEDRYPGQPDKAQETRQAFTKLLALRDAGKVELAVTTNLYSDFWKSRSVLPPHLNSLMGKHVSLATPTLFAFPLAFPTVFADMPMYERLFWDTFPGSRLGHRKYGDNRRDAWQLYTHLVAHRDVFVTTDKLILAREEILRTKWAICVMAPIECIRFDTDRL